jgi:(2Fe-2S) ferredoxin
LAKRRLYVVMCTNERPPGNPKGSCMTNGAGALRDALAGAIDAEGLRSEVRLVRTTCLDNCSQGPVMAIYPDDVWYRKVQAADVPEIVASHLKGGRPVARLLLPPDDFD